MKDRKEEGLQSLGHKTTYKDHYAPEVLETFENRHQESYIPDVKMVESKSLKLYLFSFRNQGAFHEDCVNMIMKDLVKLMNPRYIEVTGLFSPRGGISIYPYANWGRPGTKYEQLASERLARRE